jgi:hypothetical protein
VDPEKFSASFHQQIIVENHIRSRPTLVDQAANRKPVPREGQRKRSEEAQKAKCRQSGAGLFSWNGLMLNNRIQVAREK